MVPSAEESVFIGLDVGWSVKRRTCALAVKGISIDHALATSFADVETVLLTIDELIDYLPKLVGCALSASGQVVLVIDGPIGADGPPREKRAVDSLCVRHLGGRAQPSPVDNTLGQLYVDTTYRIIDSIWSLTSDRRIWLSGEAPCVGGLVIGETNPTVAMALMLPQEDPQTIPSRRRPVLFEGRKFRAKSDWYWSRGANSIVASTLGCGTIELERHHERIAGLFCLAVAFQLATDNATAIGASDGIYLVPRTLDASWQGALDAIGMIGPPPKYLATPRLEWKPDTMPVISDGLVEDSYDIAIKGDDDLVLCLCDNGGIWDQHNEWLYDEPGPIRLKMLDSPQETILLTRSAMRRDQWTSVPTTHTLARLRGFGLPHLSVANSVDLRVDVLGSGDGSDTSP